MRRLIIIRPEPGAGATLGRAEAKGLSATAMPLFRVEPVEWAPPELSGFDGLLVTSANAVRHGGSQLESLRHLPCFAVGSATAEALEKSGFTIRASGTGGVEALLGAIAPNLRLLHLCGQDRHVVVQAPQQVTPVVMYRSTPVTPPAALTRMRNAVLMVHSPRAGQRLESVMDDRESNRIAAISALAAEACGTGWAEVAIAECPRDDALLSLAERLCKGSSLQ